MYEDNQITELFDTLGEKPSFHVVRIGLHSKYRRTVSNLLQKKMFTYIIVLFVTRISKIPSLEFASSDNVSSFSCY